MNFVDWYFPVFFLVVWGGYLLLRTVPRQNLWLTLASYVFYGAWDWRFLFLLWLSTVVDFFAAQNVAAAATTRARKRWLLISLCSNLGILGLFKYFNFFVSSAVDLAQAVGVDWSPELWAIVLPVGISFYTFQTLSYTIDVYRGEMAPCKRLTDFALYVAFFPQLVAGPIERGTRLLPQINRSRRVGSDQLVQGGWLCLWGFFKKLVIADNLATFVDQVYSGQPDSGLEVILATYAFAWQIYCDFSGYSDIARGLSRLMGFDLMRNFDSPYLSQTPSEFWRRWHISLSSWLRDYLYIPLGGNRSRASATYRNLMITMLLGGLWHGAAWHFVAWGAWQGLILIIYRRAEQGSSFLAEWLRYPALWAVLLRRVIMFHLVCFGWFLFRMDSAAAGWELLMCLWSDNWAVTLLSVQCGLAVVASMVTLGVLELWLTNADDPRTAIGWNVLVGPLVVSGLMAAVWLLGAIDQSGFIYFQF